ncbi:hypothetical protein [Xanthobacter autotrophicus]|uniref:hypothetical protein n=1 Tax=Xanthobacter autotrophicus TaxID=280 RepID=UPI0037276752
MTVYLTDETYFSLVDAIRALRPDPLTEEVDRDEVVTLLGNVGDLWPVTIKPDAER